MLIEHILVTKGSDVVAVSSTDTIGDAVAVLRANRIGAVIVSDDDGATVSGILSERDIVRVVADEGPDVLQQPVTAAMTADVFTCGPKATIEDLMATMTERRIRHIPVVDGDHLVGVVSIGDIVKHRVGELATEARTLHDYVTSGR